MWNVVVGSCGMCFCVYVVVCSCGCVFMQLFVHAVICSCGCVHVVVYSCSCVFMWDVVLYECGMYPHTSVLLFLIGVGRD